MSDRADRHIPFCKERGFSYLMASGKKSEGAQSVLVTCGGTGTDTVTFADHGLKAMDIDDGDYAVIVHSEAGTAKVDENTKESAGFNLISGALNEVANVLVIGKMAGMK